MGTSILIIEDDADIAAVLKVNIEGLGFTVRHVQNGAEGLSLLLEEPFSLLVLDLQLPGMDGIQICQKLREKHVSIPILMLTSRSEEIDRVLGLEVGADDYLTKPFSIRELLARVKALLRRAHGPEPRTEAGALIVFGDVVVDPGRRIVTKCGEDIHLTAMEFDLLHFFASNPDRVFTRDQLFTTVWGYSVRGYENSLNTYISRLRNKIEDDPAEPRYLLTIRGVGYRFCAPGSDRS